MKRIISALIFTMFFTVGGVASANLGDTRGAMAQQYGEHRLVIDQDGQLWTKANWEEKGHQKAKAAFYTYSFTRQGLHFSMEVGYESEKPDALVRFQRISPDMPIKVKEVRQYFPELAPLLDHPKAITFASYKTLSRYFQELESPTRMGVLVRELQRDSYFPLLAFNIQNEGILIKQDEEISRETYIREFTLEKASRTLVHDKLDVGSPEWRPMKSYF
ncbi:hypothetical protein [Azotosporobacter soli]|uniref:hypothetical protein n=1 Tax=Azotosporobacter soli TaxID=3055040 RepID=UPI0031FE66CC